MRVCKHIKYEYSKEVKYLSFIVYKSWHVNKEASQAQDIKSSGPNTK